MDIDHATRVATTTRELAFILGKTKVGACAVSSDGSFYAGCNVEHKFRSHDIHAEVNAISSMVADGRQNLSAIVIVADREKFTPWGSCMDWVFQFGTVDTRVVFHPINGDRQEFTAGELMPHYPC